MKKISIIGNVTRDAVIREVNGRKAIGFGVAVNERFRDRNNVQQEKVTFFDCTIWRDDNTSIAQYLLKGTKVYVEGIPEIDTYESEKERRTIAVCRIRVRDLELLSPKPKTETTEIAPETEETIVPAAEGKDDLPF